MVLMLANISIAALNGIRGALDPGSRPDALIIAVGSIQFVIALYVFMYSPSADRVMNLLIFSQFSLEAVGTSVSLIQQTCQVKKKDIRKFLDGIYKSSRAVIE